MGKRLFSGVLIGALFAGFTYLVMNYKVAPVGPDGTSVGFSGLNVRVHEMTGVNMAWYEITDYFGYLAIGIAAIFALVGLIQLIRRRSLFKVDREIICLGFLFVIVIGFYIGFEKYIINYRPIIMPGADAPEASYPSSHTVLIITVLGATMMLIKRYLTKGFLRSLLRFLCFAIILVTVAGRLYSGVHWFTDIFGGVLLSLALCELYGAAIYRRHKDNQDTVDTYDDEPDEYDEPEEVQTPKATGAGYVPKH